MKTYKNRNICILFIGKGKCACMLQQCVSYNTHCKRFHSKTAIFLLQAHIGLSTNKSDILVASELSISTTFTFSFKPTCRWPRWSLLHISIIFFHKSIHQGSSTLHGKRQDSKISLRDCKYISISYLGFGLCKYRNLISEKCISGEWLT